MSSTMFQQGDDWFQQDAFGKTAGNILLFPVKGAIDNTVTEWVATFVGDAGANGIIKWKNKEAARKAGKVTVYLAAGATGYWMTLNVVRGAMNFFYTWNPADLILPIPETLGSTLAMTAEYSALAGIVGVSNWLAVYQVNASAATATTA